MNKVGFGFLSRLNAEGRIGKTGFSYHGDADTLDKILQAHPDAGQVSIVLRGMNTMAQLQDNMRDMSPLTAEEYDLLKKAGALLAKNITIPDYFHIYNWNKPKRKKRHEEAISFPCNGSLYDLLPDNGLLLHGGDP